MTEWLKAYGLNVLAIILTLVIVVATIRLFYSFREKRDFNIVRFMARVAIFGAMATILYVIEIFTIKLPFFPSWLSLHFDEIPAFICGFAYGPWAGVAVLGIKTLIKLPFTSTATVGEWSDLVMSTIYILIVCYVYRYKRNLKGVAIGFAIGTAAQILVAMVLNVYALVPFYAYFYGIPLEGLLHVAQIANPAIKNVGWSYAFLAVLPFNALKDAIVIVLTFLVYRSIHVFLRFQKPTGKPLAKKEEKPAEPKEEIPVQEAVEQK